MTDKATAPHVYSPKKMSKQMVDKTRDYYKNMDKMDMAL